MSKRILVVAAHPDDEILGCGGTIAKYASQGFEVFTLILGEGITSRDNLRNSSKRKYELEALQNQSLRANKIIGVKDLFSFNFPDNRFDTVPFLDIVKAIEKIKREISPKIVFTHFAGDLNIDHQITSKAVLTATRPMQDEVVKELYAFEVLSATEWNYNSAFRPNYFVNIEDFIDLKKEAMLVYKDELREFPHPRSLVGIENLAQRRGIETGFSYAEAFQIIRKVEA